MEEISKTLENGVNLDVVKQIKEVKRGRIKEYLDYVKDAEYHEGCKGIWSVKCDIALPCATQNELTLNSAKKLVENGTIKFANNEFYNDKYKDLTNITLGIRPEKMNTNGDIKFSVAIDMCELLGSEKIAYFNIGNNKCSAKLPPDFDIKDNIELSINPGDIYFFDANTGKRI